MSVVGLSSSQTVCKVWLAVLLRTDLLRTRYFWTGAGPKFRPYIPNPARTNVLFGHVTHPTALPQPMPTGVLGR